MTKNHLKKIEEDRPTMKAILINFNTYGGQVHYISQLANALSEIIDVTIIAPVGIDKSNFLKPIRIIELKVGNVMNNFLVNTIIPWRPAIFLRALFREKPSVIHFTEPNLWSGILLPFLHELPVVTTVHDVHSHLGSRSLDHDFAQKLHVFFSDRLIVHGEKSREELKQNYKCDIIPHGDYSFFARLRSDEPSEEEGAVLFFGRIEPYKGLKYLIEATHIVSQKLPNVKLIIAGSGDISRYEGLIVDKRVIEMHNRYIPDSEVPIFFRRASIVVLPYIEATQSGIIPIAYAFGKPVIASRVGDIPDVIESEKTGILVESGNSKVLANAMIRLLTNEQLRNEMGFNARRKMETELSWRIIAGRTVEVYRKAMNRKNKK